MSERESQPSARRGLARSWLAGQGRNLAALALAIVVLAGILALRNGIVDAPLDRLAAAQEGENRVYTGSWYFPRGGPYILGFESARAARLVIDGRPIANGAGRRLNRVVFPAGVKAVRLEAGPGARLLWHPPGRRGPPEYVPPSSLAPEPPEKASFGAWVGASPIDGLAGILALLVLVALILYLARGALARIDGRAAVWALGVFAVALAARLYDLGGAGQTWDEDVNWSAGRNYITNWLALDFRPASWEWNYEHPPVMKYIAGIGAQWADGYGPARGLSALVLALACALLVAIGRRLYSLRVGVLAGLIAALSPHLIAHGKIVGHEAPTAFLWMLAIWLCLRAHDGATLSASSPSAGSSQSPADARDALPGRLAVIGIVLGLAVLSRFVNALLLPLAGSILLVMAPRGRRRRTVVLGLAIMVPVIIAVGFAIWPRLWSEPFLHMQEAWIKLRKPHSPEPFLGAITNVPPRHYFLVYLGATAPAGILALALAWLGRVATRWRQEGQASAVVALWLLVPMLVLLSPVRQDGVRYIIPCLLALALMAASGLDFAISALAGRLRRSAQSVRRMTAIAGAAVVLYLVVTCVRVHPYYLDYYGEHVGGPAGVAESRSFEIAWWGEGIADAIEHVNRHAEEGARVFKRCVEPSHLTWLRGDLWATEARSASRADWIIAYQPSWRPCPVPPGARLVHEVSAQGAPLARVYRVSE